MQPELTQVRRAQDRGKTEIGWLHSRHSFSFGRYYDPHNVGYRALRVLNDDVVDPANGFGEHGHDNMEIITWVLEGALRHTDSTGTDGELRPGEAQVMTAGRGIRHSEINPSPTNAVHFLQIWIEPNVRNLPPSYAQKMFAESARQGRWQILASPDGREGSLQIHQDAVVSVAEVGDGSRLDLSLGEDRYGYLHLAFGSAQIGEVKLTSGDALTIDGPASLGMTASERSQFLLFDLA